LSGAGRLVELGLLAEVAVGTWLEGVPYASLEFAGDVGESIPVLELLVAGLVLAHTAVASVETCAQAVLWRLTQQ
jgi:hypothetical protein